jgi:radical SAM-linked protein
MRIRISFQKISQLRFTSTLDLQTIWERSLRRANIRIEYSKGFHPQPRIQIGVPLPLGFVGLDEKVDIWIQDTFSIDELLSMLQGKLPAGLKIINIEEIPAQEKTLSSKIRLSEYKVFLFNKETSSIDIQNRINELILLEEIIRTKRNGKKYDLRPLIESIELNIDPKNAYISLILLSQQNKTGRADEVMFALGFQQNDFLVERTGYY